MAAHRCFGYLHESPYTGGREGQILWCVVQKMLNNAFQARKPLPYQHAPTHDWMCGHSHSTERVWLAGKKPGMWGAMCLCALLGTSFLPNHI